MKLINVFLCLVYRRFIQRAEYENAVYIFGVAVDFGAFHRRRFTKIGLIRGEVRNKCYHHHYYHKFLLSLLLLLLFKKIIIIIIIIIIMITKICSLKNYAVNYNTQTSSSQSD